MTIVVGTPDPVLVDWSMRGGADFVAPFLWRKDGVPVDMTSATVTVLFSAAPTGGVIPQPLSSTAPNSEGGTVELDDGLGSTNLRIIIPAAAVAAYRFANIRYEMVVDLPGSGVLPWARGYVTLADDR